MGVYHVLEDGRKPTNATGSRQREETVVMEIFRSYENLSMWKRSANYTLQNQPDHSLPLTPLSMPLHVHIEFQESQNRGAAVASCDRRNRLLKYRQHSLFGFDRPYVLGARRAKEGWSKYEWVTGRNAYHGGKLLL